MEADKFLIVSARRVAFERLPAKVKHQFAFRHFYTEELDRKASAVSVKFLSLMVMYFCAIFKLEGRRRQYEERPSEKSGRDFANAHRRAQLVFFQLANTYSVIVMRYSCHRILEVVLKPPPGKGAHHATVVREPAFRYGSDEMVFFELLFQLTADVVRMAFDGDASVQELAVEETNTLFRSKSYLFDAQQRSDHIALVVKELDKKAPTVLENNNQLAELLVKKEQKLMMKHANQQRSPFSASHLPGGTDYLKYQRVHRSNTNDTSPSAAEQAYMIQMSACPFAKDHRAVVNAYRTKTASCRATSMSHKSNSSETRQQEATRCDSHAGEDTAATSSQGNGVADTTAEVDADSGEPSSTELDQGGRGTRAGTTILDVTMFGESQGTALQEGDDGEAALEEFRHFLNRPAIEWMDTDLMPDLSAIYQALANGVVVTTLSIPVDLKLMYDSRGILLLDSVPDV